MDGRKPSKNSVEAAVYGRVVSLITREPWQGGPSYWKILPLLPPRFRGRERSRFDSKSSVCVFADLAETNALS